jgi:hypothetical protein
VVYDEEIEMNLLDAIEQSGALHNFAKPETTTFTDAELQVFVYLMCADSKAFQAGRDSMQLEMSQQETIAYVVQDQKTLRPSVCFAKDTVVSYDNLITVKEPIALICKQQPPQTNKEGE